MKYLTASLLVATLGLTGAASAQDMSKAVEARQSVMQLYQFNLVTLGGMARGTIDYDLDAAKAAAGNLVKLSSQNQMAYWPAGTAEGEIDGSKALPAIWENFPDVGAKSQALVDAAMTAEAAGSLEELQAAMGAVGGACGACHKAYRASTN